MGFFKSLGKAVAGAGDALAGVAEEGLNGIGEVASDALETVGNGVSDLAAAAGDGLGGIPIIGGALSAVAHWTGDGISGLLDLGGAVIKGSVGVLAGFVAGSLRVVFGGLGGLLAWDGRVFKKGLADIATGLAGGVLIVGGKLIAFVQTTVLLQRRKRRLTPFEKDILRRVCRQSLATYNIRIVSGFAGVYSVSSRPFTLGNTIYVKGRDVAREPELLVHEATHVWQYQHREARYTADALAAQMLIHDEYEWKLELSRGKKSWQEFNFESQGKFLEDLYLFGSLLGLAASQGVFYKDDPVGDDVEFKVGRDDYTALAKAAVAYVRSRFSLRPSRVFAMVGRLGSDSEVAPSPVIG